MLEFLIIVHPHTILNVLDHLTNDQGGAMELNLQCCHCLAVTPAVLVLMALFTM